MPYGYGGGLADGFAQGFGLVNQYQQQQFQNRQNAQQQRLQEKRYQSREQDRRAREHRAQVQEQVKAMYSRLASGLDPTEEDQRLLQENPQYDPGFIASPEMGEAIEAGKRVIDPEHPADANSPESLRAFNYMFGPRINRGHGKHKIVTGIYPGKKQGHVAMDLEVTDDDGNTYRAPMTKNRGKGGEDDEVLEVPVQNLADHLAGYEQLHKTLRDAPGVRRQAQQSQGEQPRGLQMTDEQRQQALKYGRNMGLLPEQPHQYKTIQGPDGALFQVDQTTGQQSRLLGRRPTRSAASGRMPSDATMIEYLVSHGTPRDEATQQVMGTHGRNGQLTQRDRVEMQLDNYDSRIEAVNKQLTGNGAMLMDDDQRQKLENRQAQLQAEKQRYIQQTLGGGGSSGGLDTSSRSARQSSSSQPQQQAPTQAVQYLQQHDSPHMREMFRQKYGYLPEGMN